MIYILGELRDPGAMDALKTIMIEDDSHLVAEAAKAAGKISGPMAMDLLLIMMHHPSFLVRGEVALAMGEMDHPKKDELLNRLLLDISPYVANCAHSVLNRRCNQNRKGIRGMPLNSKTSSR